MPVKLNQKAFDHAKRLIEDGKLAYDDRDSWSEDQPTTEQENGFIKDHGFAEYGKWYLGINTDEGEDTKGRYEFPYGDFERVHRCGVLSAESRAGQYKHADIENAASHLHDMIEKAHGQKAA